MNVIEIVFQGEGGHGSVVAAKLLAKAAAKSGFQAQSFASYGALRRGGKVEGYVRISEEKIPMHSKIYSPDYLVIMDESLLESACRSDIFKENTQILVNGREPKADYPELKGRDVYAVDAYGIAKGMGLVIPGGMPIINTTLLGGLVKILGNIKIEHLLDVIGTSTPKPDKNMACAKAGYQGTNSFFEESSDDLSLEDHRSENGNGSRHPVYQTEKMAKCHRCQICYIVCPNLAITVQMDPFGFEVNKEICTGCGICIEECPRKAISWEGE